MAKFRIQHRQTTGIAATIIRVGLMLGILLVMLFLFDIVRTPALPSTPIPVPEPNFLPMSSTGRLIYEAGVWISIDASYRQPEWVAYRLDSASLGQSLAAEQWGPYQAASFLPEGWPQQEPARHGSMRSSPLHPEAWRLFSEALKRWQREYAQIYVISGPVLSLASRDTLAEYNKPVPAAYFAVLAAAGGQSLAFLIPNTDRLEALRTYAVSIDAVEKISGINFFPGMTDFTSESVNHVDLWRFKP
jgi:endonuclease G